MQALEVSEGKCFAWRDEIYVVAGFDTDPAGSIAGMKVIRIVNSGGIAVKDKDKFVENFNPYADVKPVLAPYLNDVQES